MTTLSILLVIYIVLLLLSLAFAVQLWWVYRTQAYKTLVAIWLCTALNFMLQGLFTESIFGSLLSFPTYIVVVYYTCSLLTQVSLMPFYFKPFGIAFGVSILISLVMFWLEGSFALVAFPVAVTIAAPQLYFALTKLVRYSHTGTQFSNSFAVLLLFNGLHFLDYPFLRPIPDMAILGYGLVLVFSIGFATLLPTILSKYHTNRSDVLLREIQKRNQVEQELELALDKAEHLANVKTEFLANMSHEIRTPLTGIIGLNELLLTTKLDAEQREYCDDIAYASGQLRGIINNILSLSKLESGTIIVEHQPFNLQALCDDIDKHYALNTTLSLPIRYSVRAAHLVGDQGKLQQILFNLIDNAIKYSQGNAIVVDFSYDSTTAMLRLVVADDGIGIDKKIKQKLFHRFQQNQNPEQHEGVGLGLAIVNELLAVMNGQLTLESEPGEGAQFICHIPMEESKQEKVKVKVKVNKASGSRAQSAIANQRFHLLVIDDDPLTLQILSRQLRKANYRCDLADDGTTAKALFNQCHFDLILSDIQLPDVEGFELIRYFREGDRTVPILAHSAFAFDEDVTAAIAAGVTDYIRKPTTFAEIHAKLSIYLDVVS